MPVHLSWDCFEEGHSLTFTFGNKTKRPRRYLSFSFGRWSRCSRQGPAPLREQLIVSSWKRKRRMQYMEIRNCANSLRVKTQFPASLMSDHWVSTSIWFWASCLHHCQYFLKMSPFSGKGTLPSQENWYLTSNWSPQSVRQEHFQEQSLRRWHCGRLLWWSPPQRCCNYNLQQKHLISTAQWAVLLWWGGSVIHPIQSIPTYSI